MNSIRLIILYLALLFWGCQPKAEPENFQGIMVYPENPFYFQYKGKPILLVGATDYHNIFQRKNLVEELEKLLAHGGNYVRNTMASREIMDGHRDLWPYKAVAATPDSLIFIYDLNRWNDVYWEKFDQMLRETKKRDIIVEVGIWERHDNYRTRDQAGWLRHPFNPDNNVNFTREESGMPVGEWPEDVREGHPFFATVPQLQDNALVLEYQKQFVDKILSYTFQYDHVLYNMNNETREHYLFAEYWAHYVLEKAREKGLHIEITDMPDAHDITDETISHVIKSDLYTFIDISQNNFQKGELHWERIHHVRNQLVDNPKPITNIKTYGSDDSPWNVDFWGNTQDGQERFWRNIFGGCASARFHRPPWGIGSSPLAMANLKSMRMLTDSMDFFRHKPSNHLLSERESNEAYCMAIPGEEYAIFFPAGGSVRLNTEGTGYKARWLNIQSSRWSETFNMDSNQPINTPDEGLWVLWVKK
jgi:hypothetical protein